MLDALRREQARLRDGRKAYFDLSSGAPASYDQNRIGPRDAFVALDLDDVWQIERKSRDGEVFPRYQLTLMPDGHNAPIWTVDVTMTQPRQCPLKKGARKGFETVQRRFEITSKRSENIRLALH